MCDNNELLFTHPKSYTHTLPLLKTSAFPVSPDNAGTSSYTSWFSGWRGRNHSLVTRCSLPPLPSFFKLLLHSVFLPHSSALLCHLLFPHCSHLCLLLPPKQGHTDSGSGKKKKGLHLEGEGTRTNKQTFLGGGRMFPRTKGIFTCRGDGLRSEKHELYLYRLCLSPVVEVGRGSCI